MACSKCCSECCEGCKSCWNKCVVLFAVVNLATLGFALYLASTITRDDNNIGTIQRLLQIYGLETNIGSARIGILVCSVLVSISVLLAFICIFCTKYTNKDEQVQYGKTIVYTLCVIAMFIASIVFGFLSATYDCQFDDGLEVALNTSLKEDYLKGKGVVAKAWDNVQLELSCCGVVGPANYADVVFNAGIYVPSTCCKHRPFNETVCQYEANQLLYNQTSDAQFLNTAGCYSRIKSNFHDYLMHVMRTSFIMSGAQVMCLVLTLYIICTG